MNPPTKSTSCSVGSAAVPPAPSVPEVPPAPAAPSLPPSPALPAIPPAPPAPAAPQLEQSPHPIKLTVDRAKHAHKSDQFLLELTIFTIQSDQ